MELHHDAAYIQMQHFFDGVLCMKLKDRHLKQKRFSVRSIHLAWFNKLEIENLLLNYIFPKHFIHILYYFTCWYSGKHDATAWTHRVCVITGQSIKKYIVIQPQSVYTFFIHNTHAYSFFFLIFLAYSYTNDLLQTGDQELKTKNIYFFS